MKRPLLALLLTAAPVGALTHIEFVTVGDTAPPASYWVPRGYRMGKYEITNAQYADFLNAVAATSDPHGLYDPLMGSDPRGGIARAGRPSEYTTRPFMAQKPVNFVSWFDAARFCNWLHHGQPGGAAGAASTEDGAYDLAGSGTRQPKARYAIPSFNEWVKAAYFDPVSPAADTELPADIWRYPTQSDAPPVAALATSTGGVANPGPGVANYANGAIWGGVTGHLVNVGACGAASHYGTHDQAGNVSEWTERFWDDSTSERIRKGGSFSSAENQVRTSVAEVSDQQDGSVGVGIRVLMPMHLIEPEMVGIGEPGNPADTFSSLGAVSAPYRIGRSEVLNEEWVAFLNAQDDTGAYSLWHPDMQSTAQGGIARTGSAGGGFVYWVKPGHARMPVTHLSAVDAMRFCNWLHHGQPVRGADSETIVGGAYDAGSASVAAARLSGARWFLPTPSEWTKAARYDSVNSAADAGNTTDYWLTPFLTDLVPGSAPCDAAGQLLAPGPAANCGGAANWNGSTGGNVTAAGSAGPNSLSPWGCADMAGNARELTEGTGTTVVRTLGGSYDAPAADILITTTFISPDENTSGLRLAARVLPAPIATVPVSGPDTGDFRIGEFEITNAQYVAFLIAIGAAASDPLELYDTRMASDPRGGITKVTLLGTTTFVSRASMADKPVNFVNWFDAARFCNWLHHGQPSGAGSLDHGAYQLNQGISDSDNIVSRASTARWHLPDLLQWNAAAYYTPTGKGLFSPGTHYTYATQNDFPPIPATATSTGGVSNPGPDTANYDNAADWNGQNGHVTTVGACGARSPWGCADMMGNVTEWIGGSFEIEGLEGNYAGRAGGTWLQSLAALTAENTAPAVNGFNITGFRVAAAPASISAGGNLRILSFTAQDSTHFRLVFSSRIGKGYTIQSQPALTGTWTNLVPNIPGTGQPQTIILTKIAGQPRRYYRVREE